MVQPFLPNEADAFNANQAEPDSVDFEILLLGHQRTGVLSGCAVSEDPSTPDMTVDVTVGEVVETGEQITVSAQLNNTVTAADGTNPRIDLVTVNGSGTVVVTAGTAAAQPVAPAIPATSVPLAFLYVPTSDTSIADNQITDKRVFVDDLSVFNVKDFGATGDGTTDDKTAVQATIDACNVAGGGTVFFPAGTYRLITGLTTTGVDDIWYRGEGPISILDGDAGITILQLHGSRFRVSDLAFKDGAIGMQVDTGLDSYFHNLRFDDQTANGILIDGDGAMEQFYMDIQIRTAGVEAFKYTRTTITDTGGLYMARVNALDDGTGTGPGFLFTSSNVAVTPAYVSMYECISNNYVATGIKFDNVSRINIEDCQFLCNSAAAVGTAALHFDDGFLIQISRTVLFHPQTTAGAFCLLLDGAVHEVLISGVVFDGAANTTAIGATNAGANIVIDDHYSYVGTFTNDYPNLVTGAGVTFAPPRSFYTRHDGGVNDVIAIKNATDTGQAVKYILNNFGEFLIKNDAFDTDLFRVTDAGIIGLVGGNIHGGTGTPEGSITGGVGDVFMRDDGALGTMLYYKASGAGNTGWRPIDTGVKEESGAVTLDWEDGIVNVDTSGGAVVVTLPDVSAFTGKNYLIRRDGANTVTINRAGSDTFDTGATSIVLGKDGDVLDIISIGDGEWKIV